MPCERMLRTAASDRLKPQPLLAEVAQDEAVGVADVEAVRVLEPVADPLLSTATRQAWK